MLIGAAVAPASAAPAFLGLETNGLSVSRTEWSSRALNQQSPEERYAIRTSSQQMCCTVEIAGGGALVSPLDGTDENTFAGVGRLLGFAAITDETHIGGGLQLDGTGAWTALVGVRRLLTVDRLESRLDLQLASDVSPSFALGARVGAGLAWTLNRDSASAPRWSVGAGLGFAAFAFRARIVADASAMVTAEF